MKVAPAGEPRNAVWRLRDGALSPRGGTKATRPTISYRTIIYHRTAIHYRTTTHTKLTQKWIYEGRSPD